VTQLHECGRELAERSHALDVARGDAAAAHTAKDAWYYYYTQCTVTHPTTHRCPPPHVVQEEVLQHTQCTDVAHHTGAHHPM
jgi:hypothetical protein